jgi:glycosyltransferase involved in cell wall biosynthesis
MKLTSTDTPVYRDSLTSPRALTAALQKNAQAVIDRPYLMVTFIPCFLDGNDVIWLEQGWRHDLIEHFQYLKDFTLCAPKARKGAQPNLVPIEVPEGVRFRFVELPAQSSAFKALLRLPRTAFVIWGAIGRAEIVHSSVIGWPYPLGWIANPFAVIRRKALVIVVESSWRSEPFRRLSLIRRLWDTAKESAARWSCNHADVALFTQSFYRDALHSGATGSAYVTPAVWINEADILDEADAQRSWNSKMTAPVRMLFAGRLATGKGVSVLLQALRILDERGVKARVDIIGEGGLRQSCIDAAAELSSAQLSVLDPVPYGAPFFELVRAYHALLIPSLSDEQPRVVFDANAQAVPVIASDTPGLRPHVEDGQTGWLIGQGKPEVLAAAIEIAIADPEKLRSMGMTALAATHGHTHVAMHCTRSHILKKHLCPD